MAKGGIFPESSGGFFQPFQSGVNKLFSGSAGARPDPHNFRIDSYSGMGDRPGPGGGIGGPNWQFDAAAHKRADAHWVRMKELDAQKQKIFSDLRAYGNKDLSPDAPSHQYVGEDAGEYEPQDMGLADTYLDILNPSKYADYDEFERERDNMFTYTG